MKIYNVGIDLKRAFTDVLRGIVQNEDVMFKTVISDDGKPIDYSTCNIIMVAVRLPDYTTEKTLETVNIVTANAKKGIVEFKLPKEFTEQEGVHQLQIAFFDKGNMVKTARFNYCVEDGLLLDEPSETEIITTEDLLRKASEALVTSQEIREAESVRIAAEELRNTAEEARISNELERKSAEAFREEKELARGKAEADRKEAEDIRLEQEGDRVENERERGNNENERIEAEVRRENKLNNMAVNAISIDSESDAYAETLITEDSISVTIGVPKGEKGDKGDKGEKGDSGEAQSPFVFACELEMSYDGSWSVTSSTNYEEIVSSFQKGQTVIAQAALFKNSSDGTTSMSTVNLICLGEVGNIMPGDFTTMPYVFTGVTTKNEIVRLEWYTFMSADKRTIKVIEATSKEYVDEAIGDIEASLENIINKYGLGGEA